MDLCSLYMAVLLLGFGLPEGQQLAQVTPPAAARPVPESPAVSPAAPGAVSSAPALHLETTGPAFVNVGQPVIYEILLRNTGPVAIFGVRVDEQLPSSARFVGAEPRAEVRDQKLTWNVGVLDPGAERRFRVEVQASAEGEFQSSATVTASSSAHLQTRITRPRITLSKTGPATVQIDDPAVFQIEVTNTGTGPATHVLLHDELPPGLRHPTGRVIEADIGTLPVGASKKITLETTAVQVGKQVNEAVVTADGGIRTTAEAVVLVTQAGLKLRKDGPRHRFLGREAEYDFEVNNPGSGPATNVRLLDLVPEGLDFVAASDGGTFDAATRQVVWALGTLAPGQRRGLSLRLMTKLVGDWVNRAAIRADRGLEDRAESSLHVEGVPALMLEVVDLDDPVEVGAETTYEIRVVNQGTCACTGLRILATVPPEMQTLEANGPAPHSIHGQQVLFEPLPTLAAKADCKYLVRVRGVKPGDVRFRVQMTCDQLTIPVLEEESTHVYDDQR